MNRLVSWLEDYILPFANRLAQVRWLVALRDAFISIMPITFAGSIAVLIKSLVEASKTHLDWKIFAFIMQPVVAISNVVWRGTFSLFALFLAFSLGYHLAKSLETNRLAGAIVSLASFTMSVANFTKLRVNGKNFFLFIMLSTSRSFQPPEYSRLFCSEQSGLQFMLPAIKPESLSICPLVCHMRSSLLLIP